MMTSRMLLELDVPRFRSCTCGGHGHLRRAGQKRVVMGGKSFVATVVEILMRHVVWVFPFPPTPLAFLCRHVLMGLFVSVFRTLSPRWRMARQDGDMVGCCCLCWCVRLHANHLAHELTCPVLPLPLKQAKVELQERATRGIDDSLVHIDMRRCLGGTPNFEESQGAARGGLWLSCRVCGVLSSSSGGPAGSMAGRVRRALRGCSVADQASMRRISWACLRQWSRRPQGRRPLRWEEPFLRLTGPD